MAAAQEPGENISAPKPAAPERALSDAGFGPRLLSAGADCMIVLDADGTVRTINEAGCKAFEIDDSDSLVDTSWQGMWPAAAHPKVEWALAEARAGRVARFSAFCPTAKSAPRWWDVAVSPITDEHGARVWLLSVSRDITAQRLFEHRFDALADNMAQLAWMADASGGIFWYNHRWFDYTGTTPGEMANVGWLRMLHAEHVDRVRAKISDAFKSGSEYEDTFPLRAKDGTYCWFLFRAMPIRAEDGTLQLWCGTSTDITEQRNLGSRLRQNARLIELSHEAILARDEERGIVLWNRGCEELYGFSKAEALGARSDELLKTTYPIPIAEFEATLHRDGRWTGVLVQMTRTGEYVWVESRQEVMRVEGRDITLETNRDITGRMEAEHTREVLIGELYHRVNNTLAIVQSMAAQTARNCGSTEQFIANFNSRLVALAKVHGVLSNAHWVSADLRELIVSQLSSADGIAPEFLIEGPSAALAAQAAIQLGMVLCELTSNAKQHGALAQPGGTVSITWDVASEAGTRRLMMTWRERGGPPVTPPDVRRFGLTLIERSRGLPYLDLKLEFDPAGLVCRISAELVDTPSRTVFFDRRKRRGP